jgi:hypothetical protein
LAFQRGHPTIHVRSSPAKASSHPPFGGTASAADGPPHAYTHACTIGSPTNCLSCPEGSEVPAQWVRTRIQSARALPGLPLWGCKGASGVARSCRRAEERDEISLPIGRPRQECRSLWRSPPSGTRGHGFVPNVRQNAVLAGYGPLLDRHDMKLCCLLAERTEIWRSERIPLPDVARRYYCQ